MTRLSKVHPYPAMIADHLAAQLSNEYVTSKSRVLDPFCGTGRVLMAAASRGAYCVGLDVNPLASLIVNAKACSMGISEIATLLSKIDKAMDVRVNAAFDFEPGRRVEWFSIKAKEELQAILMLLNRDKMDKHILELIATILSATVREVSYCRKDQWKLHRMSPVERECFYRSPWRVFKRRLEAACKELQDSQPLKGSCSFILGDSRKLSYFLKEHGELHPFDAIITSPPYGDSQSTVQYGAMSGLSLGVIRHLKALKFDTTDGCTIDNACLGTSYFVQGAKYMDQKLIDIKKYWHGSRLNPSFERVNNFLRDLEICCHEMCSVIKRKGVVIYVISRRSTGGWRLYMDLFLMDVMARNKFALERVIHRKIDQKMTPYLINRMGRGRTSLSYSRSCVQTMHSEYILVFRKK
jgi:site-specific DNA-methyltransferase (cytosine-N4-specific)